MDASQQAVNIALTAAVSDSGMPGNRTDTLAFSWTSADSRVALSTPSARTASAALSDSGVYRFQVAVRNGAVDGAGNPLITTAAVAITANRPAVVDAGPGGVQLLSSPLELDGTVADDGLPVSPGIVTVTWSKASGPGTVVFDNPNAAFTVAHFPQKGVYELQLAASDGDSTSTSKAVFTVVTAPQASIVADTATLTVINRKVPIRVNIADTGLPSPQAGTVSVTWSVLPSDSPAVFDDPSAASTNVTFPDVGVFVVTARVDNGGLWLRLAVRFQPWS